MTSTPNVDLLRQTMDEILANPDKHDQSMWARRTDCGTAYCFAGTACRLSGMEFDFSGGDNEAWWLADGRRVSEAAAHLLGLDVVSAAMLFSANNEVADLKHYVDEIADHGRVTEGRAS